MTKFLMRLVVVASLIAIVAPRAMAAISFVQQIGTGSLAAGGATSFTIPVTTPVAAGDVIVLEVVYSGSTNILSPNLPIDSGGNTYIVRGGAFEVFDDTLATMDYVASVTTALQPGDMITIGTGAVSNTYNVVAAAQEFSGLSTDIDNFANGVSRSGGITADFATSDIVTANADDLIYAYLAIQSSVVAGLDQTTTPPFVSPAQAVQLNGITLLPLYSIKSLTGSYGLAGSFATTDNSLPAFDVVIHSLKASTAATNANLTVTKSHAGNFAQGQNAAAYTLIVNNTGTAATSGTIVVTDNLPAGLTFASGSGPGWSCSAAVQITTCTSTTPISLGGSSVISLLVNVAANATSPVVNQASVGCAAPCTVSGNPASDPTIIASQTPPSLVAQTPALNWLGIAMLVLLLGAATQLLFHRSGKPGL